MRNHLDKRVLRRAWTTKPSDRESAFPDGVELVNHLTGYKGLQIRGEQLGPLRGKQMLGSSAWGGPCEEMEHHKSGTSQIRADQARQT